MKTFIALITIFLVTVVVSSSPVDLQRATPRDQYIQQTKGWPAKGPPPTPVRYPTKGEYVCGNRMCKLVPGEIPKGCNGMCQYPILL